MIKFSKALYVIFMSCVLYFVPFFAFAAQLYFNPENNEASTGDIVQIEVRLDAESQDINAIDAVINLPSEVEFKDFSDGGSVISLWTRRPKVKDSKVSFSGLVPGGFREDGLLLKLVLGVKKAGNAEIYFDNDSIALLNDGYGTHASVKFKTCNLQITETIDNSALEFQNLWANDANPPEKFEPRLVQMEDVFDGKYFVVFFAQDKDSGIDYYEVLDGEEWVVAESPYVLKNQDLKEDIQIKAVDKAGNARIAEAALEKKVGWHKTFIWGIMIGGVVFVAWKKAIKKYISV